MAEFVYPLGLIWEAPIPDLESGLYTAEYSSRGNVEDIGTTYVENGLFDDPVNALPDTYGMYGFSWRKRTAVMTGAPATLPANTTSVRLRASGQITYDRLDKYPEWPTGYPEVRVTMGRSDFFYMASDPTTLLRTSTTYVNWSPWDTGSYFEASTVSERWVPAPPPAVGAGGYWVSAGQVDLITPPVYPAPFVFDTDYEMNFAEVYLTGPSANDSTNPFPIWDNHDTVDMDEQSLYFRVRYMVGFSGENDEDGALSQLSYTFQNLVLELVVTTEATGGVFLNTFSVGSSMVG